MTTRPTPVPRGRFITLVGPEGSGKTSQAEALRARLAAGGAEVVLTREPGGTATGERIRAILLHHDPPTSSDAPAGREPARPTIPAPAGPAPRTDALLFNAARAELVATVIRPATDRGAIVLCARYADSTLAYQGHGAGLPLDDLHALERFATGGLRPDLTLLLDLPPEVGLARKAGDEVTRFEAGLDLAFHERVRAGFLALAAAEPDRFAVIDAGLPFDEVLARIVGAVGERLPELAGVLGRASEAGTDEPAPATQGTPP